MYKLGYQRKTFLALSGVLLGLYAPISAAQTMPINLPAQSLDRDVRDLARQTGITISYSRRALKRYKGKAISGHFTAREILGVLLKDTNYNFEFVNDNTVRIFKRRLKTQTPGTANTAKPRTPPTSLEIPLVLSNSAIEKDEIIVTANKRDRFDILQSAPYSVSVVSNNMLKTLGVTDTPSLSIHIAGVEMTNLGLNRNKMSIRGISDGAFNGRVQSTVGVYFNDTPINYNSPYPEIPLVDIDSIEVLRGPQGSLYGTGSIGGIFKITPNSPELRNVESWLQAGVSTTHDGGFNSELMAMVNMPIVKDKLGLRAVGYTINNSGYIDDIRLEKDDINKTRNAGGRLKARWQITPDWRLSAGVAYQDVQADDTQYALENLPRLQRDNYIAEPHSDNLLHTNINIVGDFQWGRLKSTTSRIKRDINHIFDASLSVPQNLNRPVEPTSFTENREIDFVSHETTMNVDVNDWLDILVGGFFTRANSDYLSEYKILGAGNRGTGNQGAGNQGMEVFYSEVRNDVSTHYGGFGEIDIKPSNKWEISAGLRWFDEHLTTKTLIDDFDAPPKEIEGNKTDSDFLPRLNIGYQFTPDAFLYGLVTVGYRVGGLNTGNAAHSSAVVTPDSKLGFTALSTHGDNDDDDNDDDDDDISVFESDVITMLEFGGKTRWYDDKLTVNASAFYINWKNIQSEQIFDGGFSSVLNAGDATNLGYEFEITYHPMLNIDIQANMTVNNPDVTNFNPVLGPNVDEKHLPRIPDLSAGIILTYRKPIGQTGWRSTWSLDYAFTGASELSFATTDDLDMGNNHALNARVNLANNAWQVEGFINNILDDKSNTFAFGNPFTFRLQQHLTPQRPRTIGMRLRRQF